MVPPFVHSLVEKAGVDIWRCAVIIALNGSANLPVALWHADPDLGAMFFRRQQGFA